MAADQPTDRLREAVRRIQVAQRAGYLPSSLTIFDFETTHIGNLPNIGNPRPVELAGLRIDVSGTPARFKTLINPEIPISSGAQAVHKILPEMVRDAPTVKQALGQFEQFRGQGALVAHNLPFDFGIYQQELKRVGLQQAENVTTLDTLKLSRQAFPGLGRGQYRLGELASRFGFEAPTHRAMANVETTAQLLDKLVADVGGIEELKKLDPSAVWTPAKPQQATGLTSRLRQGLSKLSKGWKIGLAGGLAVAGGAVLFSGKDDEYNTIEGLRHGGLAEYYRKKLTDFGSGFRGTPQFRGLVTAGVGAAALAGLYGVGRYQGQKPSKKTESEDSGLGFVGKGLLAAGLFAIGGPASVYATSRIKGGLAHREAMGLLRAQSKVSVERYAAGLRAIKDTYSKETTERLAGQAVNEGIYKSKAMRALSPVLEAGGLVSHTAHWLNKNWLPELKRFEPGAVALAGLTAYEGYNIGKSAYEGEWGDVATGLVSFAGAKYAYMGWHKFLNSPEKRRNVIQWAKKQKVADWVSYASTGMSSVSSVSKVATQAAALFPQFVRTGAHPKQIGIKYGQNLIQQYTKSGLSVKEAYKDAWNVLPEEIRDRLLHPDLQRGAIELGSAAREKMNELANMDQDMVGAILKNIGANTADIYNASWASGKAAEQISKIDPARIIKVRNSIHEQISKGVQLAQFSGRDDAYNTIEGLRHGGLAAEGRKKTTPFGSGYDAARGLAQSLGMTYSVFLKSSVFRNALQNATTIKELGEGVAGRAFLMSTQVAGQEFKYVSKKLRPLEETAEMLMRNTNKMRPQNQINIEQARIAAEPFRDFFKEYRAMNMLRDTKTVPTAYSVSPDEIMMELMPGQALKDIRKTQGSLTYSLIEDMQSTAREAGLKGIVNEDIHGGNILYDAATGRTSWIDWGATNFFSPGANEIQQAFLTRAMLGKVSAMKKHFNLQTPIVGNSVTPGGFSATPGMLSSTPGMSGVKQQDISDKTPLLVNRSISGMSEVGFASTKRKSTTDFGSPWRGLLGGVSRKITKYMASGARADASLLLDPRKAAKMANSKSLEEFAEAIGARRFIVKNQAGENLYTQLTKKYKGLEGGAGVVEYEGAPMIVMSPERVKRSFLEAATKGGMDTSVAQQAIEHDDFLKTVMYHELLEQQVKQRFVNIKPMPAQHLGSQVLIGEGGFLQLIQNKEVRQLFTTVRKARKEEYAALHAGFEAFQEEGVAPVLRKLVSDFGSGYRGLLDSTSITLTRSNHAAKSLYRSSLDLRKAQEQIWHCAIRGGRYHNKRGGSRHVKQLSSFGGALN